MDSLQKSQRNIQDLQRQIASGDKYTTLSENPSAVSRSLTVNSALNANTNYQANSKDAVTMLKHADSALYNVLNAAQTIRGLIIQAGDGALDNSQLQDITAQIEANKKIMLDNLNTKVAGQYIFGGTDTSTQPFAEQADGSIIYQGTDDRMKYAVSESVLGDINFAGSDIVPENDDSYFICSHYVPIDWKWTGREEKVQITVGNRTLSVFIPEDWQDSDINKTNSTETGGLMNYSDENGYRDPNELRGISLDDLAEIVNSSLEEQGADMLVQAYIEKDYEGNRQQLVLKSNTGEKVGITGWPDTDYMPTCAEITSKDLSGVDWNTQPSTLTVMLANDPAQSTVIEIDENETITTLADKINAINGVYARTTSDGSRLVITAERTGTLPADVLNIDEAQESLHYPSLTITGAGSALDMFDFGDGDTVKQEHGYRLKDQSHIDIFDYLGMETAMKSREFSFDPDNQENNEILTVADGEQLHWRVTSGGKTADIKLNAGNYTLADLAERLKNAGAGWLEVTIEPGGTDVADDWQRGTSDFEGATQRLVMRGYNGEQVLFFDMNRSNYADKLGLSTTLKTEAYTDEYTGTGTKCVNFPSAPCVDDNVGIPMRVQMNCGMYYDVNIRRADVVDKETGFVDRDLVMRQIVEQVNEQEGHDIMGYVQHVDETGHDISGSNAIYFLSGEAFTVVDMPFNDPEWNDYSGGIAAQMGIHGGVTSNLKNTQVPMKDNATFQDAYDDAGMDFRDGTIRFSNLAHEVEIDVSATDTVKDIMDRLRVQAGDWLYVNYYDEHMGQQATRNTGDFPLLSLSSVDGSAVNVIDVKGHIAQDALGLTTGIQGRVNYDGTGEGVMDFEWDVENQNFPADSLTVTVAGYSHTIDLTALRDVTNDGKIRMDDVAEFVNARMQDYDVRAEINDDNELVVWSPRGYSISIEFADNATMDFLGDEVQSRTYYRGGYNLEGDAYGDEARGLDGELYDSGIHTQNATIRSGANTMRQNGFGVINDVIAAVNAGNRDDLMNKMLPRIDGFINNILGVMAEDGALRTRYEYNNDRLVTENAIMTEQYDDLVKIDPADAISQLMIADYMYQANLAVISRLVQPSLLDFLS